ncbi:Hypothetical predicted protein [Paramuricea clavata]|uniref:Uncharacterized protein n=1 Tax=Paramuricea clavata TaxID=317549 RepID=A0A6S7JI71_PARCT|nr:Hypothetical predicted protein [Paramuricea clavata]
MGSNQQDFNNQAFVPYAINGGETVYVPNGKYDTLDCKDDGYVKPFVNVDPNKNHEYENPADVAKRAGLNRAGSGPRRKKNQLYGDTKKQRVRLPDTPTTPTDGAESSPLVVTIQQEHEKSKTRKCDIKMVIFFILVLCLSAGGLALSLLNMLNKENCLCSRRGKRLHNSNNTKRFIYFMPEHLPTVYLKVARFHMHIYAIRASYFNTQN